jgi:FKBP-type peptidyl-prolyl cis-trans isomerase 2
LSIYSSGDYFQPNQYLVGIVKEVTDKEMVVDFNHELAGKNLIFDVTVKNVF